jgi:hypothetical protein
MWSGRQTLGEIEAAIAKLHRDESRLDAALGSATAEAERLRRERGDAFRELARIKLDEIGARRLVGDLDAAENRAVQLLESRRLRLEAANAQRNVAIEEAEAADSARHSAAQDVEFALAEVEELRAKAEEAARKTQAWADADKVFKAADQVASEAEKKAELASKELAAKKKPYDDDRLFAYLWQRGFGTPKYGAGNFVRMIDRMIADYIGFMDARANYAMLIEIPLRLTEHAAGRRKIADMHKAAVASIERQAMVEAGVEAKEKVLAEARHKLAAADDTAEKKKALLRGIDDMRKALVDGTGDTAYGEALRTIAEADAQDDLTTLYREARRTRTDADDLIVRKVEGIDKKLEQVGGEITSLRKSAQELARRRVEVEGVRDRFRNSGFDHPNATFRNDSDIAVVLGQILEGVVRSGILWDLLRAGFGTRQSRTRPDFGSPTFPFPFPMPGGGGEGARGGQWREPQTRGGWTAPDDFPTLPSSGGGDDRGSDDFSTGGSF